MSRDKKEVEPLPESLMLHAAVLEAYGYEYVGLGGPFNVDTQEEDESPLVAVFDSGSDQSIEVALDGSWRYVNQFWDAPAEILLGKSEQDLAQGFQERKLRSWENEKNDDPFWRGFLLCAAEAKGPANGAASMDAADLRPVNGQ